jgi:hypothetical protein
VTGARRAVAQAALAIGLALAGGALGCGCGGASVKRSYPPPTVDDVLAHLEQARRQVTSLRATSLMDYWTGDKRVKGTVWLMGRWGRYLRFNALNPDGSVAADLACNGTDYVLLDYHGNCYLTGPCTGQAIASLLRLDLEPDDFLAMIAGLTPVLSEAVGTLAWNEEDGTEVLTLTSRDGHRVQRIALDGRGRRWDVLWSTLRDANGAVLWTVKNKEFREVAPAGGPRLRVPEKSRFEQPSQDADLVVQWKTHELNVELDASKFTITIPPGLATCGRQKQGAPAAPAPAAGTP